MSYTNVSIRFAARTHTHIIYTSRSSPRSHHVDKCVCQMNSEQWTTTTTKTEFKWNRTKIQMEAASAESNCSQFIDYTINGSFICIYEEENTTATQYRGKFNYEKFVVLLKFKFIYFYCCNRLTVFRMAVFSLSRSLPLSIPVSLSTLFSRFIEANTCV